MPGLDTDRPNDPVALSDSELTIKVRSVDREDFLWEIGSGSNWLSYHVSMTLALQQFFLTLPHSPVPSFLVYDQPSQVYFPKRLVDRPDAAESSDPEWRDEDVEAVRKIFQTLARVTQQSQGRLQVIVLDHAPETVWQGIAGVQLTEDWRDGRKLVPAEWIA